MWYQRGSSGSRISVAAKAARRDDRLKLAQVEFGNGPQGLGRGGVAQPVGQGVVPGGVFGLQGEQFGDDVVPALWPGAPVGRPPIANPNDGGRAIVFVARAIDLMPVSGPGDPGREARPGLCPGPAKGTALGTIRSVITPTVWVPIP